MAWDWDFGDGATATNKSPNHTYTAQGSYTVTLTATSPAGGQGTTIVENLIVVLPDPPEAEFVADVTSGNPPLTVQFTDLSTGVANAWFWTFGDGQNSTLQNPSHDFTFAGSFNVSLLTSGPGGADSETKTDYIVLVDSPPTCDFAADVTTGTVPQTVYFTELATGVISSYDWDFGDGGTSTAQTPSHVYTTGGTFTVSLVVAGPGGSASETKVDYIVLTNTPPVAEFSADVTSGDAGRTSDMSVSDLVGVE